MKTIFNKKNFISIIFCFALLQTVMAQDKIIKTDYSVIDVKVVEITDVDIFYKKFSNPNGPTYNIKIAEVMAINYQNGEKELYNKAPEPKPQKTTSQPIPTVRTTEQTLVMRVKRIDSDVWGYVNIKGAMIIQPHYKKCYPFSNQGAAPVFDVDTKSYYFINLKGEKIETEITGFKLLNNLGFESPENDGLFPVKQGEKCGYLNSNGKVAIPLKYDYVSEFNHGYSIAKLKGEYIVLNTEGKEFKVDLTGVIDINPFSEELASFRTADKKVGFINKDGKVAIQAQFGSVGYFHSGLAWAKMPEDKDDSNSENKFGYINSNGEWVIEPKFSTAKNFDPESGMARVKIGGEWAYVNKTGGIMHITDTKSWGDFSNGLAEGTRNGKSGYFNNKGQWVIEPQFEGTEKFENGYAAVKMGDKWGVIDKEGKWIIQPAYAAIKNIEIVK